MKFFPVDCLRPQMILARPIYTYDGRVLLNSGVSLETTYIDKLRCLGVPGVYITTENMTDLHVPELISDRTRLEAIQNVKAAFDDLRLGKTFQLGLINQSINAIIDEISANPLVLISLTDIRSFDGYTFGHSVNVCVLAVLLGLRYELNEFQLRELAIGAILHDVGKIAIPEDIIKKPGTLTDDEMAEVQKHSLYGWQILRQHPEIPLQSAHVAYQHHETPNGLGYPRNLTRERISLYSRIVGAADAYDAMTSERVYRSGMAPMEALAVMDGLKDVQFDAEVVDLLKGSVAPYPVGSLVRLSNSEVGIVVDVNQKESSRPIVRVLYQADGERTEDFHEVDLAKDRVLEITQIVR